MKHLYVIKAEKSKALTIQERLLGCFKNDSLFFNLSSLTSYLFISHLCQGFRKDLVTSLTNNILNATS